MMSFCVTQVLSSAFGELCSIIVAFSRCPQKIGFEKIGFDISCKLSPQETICMKYQSLFSVENKKNMINLSSGNFFQRVVTV